MARGQLPRGWSQTYPQNVCTTSHLGLRSQYHELAVAAHLFHGGEKASQLDVVAEVAVAYSQQAARRRQGRVALLEQPHGDFIADDLLLMEGRIAQHQIC